MFWINFSEYILSDLHTRRCLALRFWEVVPTKSGPKKQKRGLESSLDSLNLELFAKVFAKKSKKNPKIELRQPPIGNGYTIGRGLRTTGV